MRALSWRTTVAILLSSLMLTGCAPGPLAGLGTGAGAPAPVAASALGAAGTVPAGWQILKTDQADACQFAVPGSWQAMAGQAAAIDAKAGASASLNSQTGQGNWDTIKQGLRAPYEKLGRPTTLLDDGTRYWFQIYDQTRRMYIYYAVTRTDAPVCIIIASVPQQVMATVESNVHQILNSAGRAQ
jgi:hypothetical protein